MSLRLVGTGTVMGIVHVLTGPDHLSALATISSNVDAPEAFGCGVRWGVGHSIGVILVGAVFIALDARQQQQQQQQDDDDDEDVVAVPEGLELFLESIVGICMLGLGCYGILTAFRSRRQGSENPEGGKEGSDGIIMVANAGMPTEEDGYRNAEQEFDEGGRTDQHHDHSHHHHHEGQLERFLEDSAFCRAVCCCCCCGCCKPSKKVLSVGIGIVHGVAGPGGILGVIPAVQLHDWKLAVVYLGSFAVTSTLVMGVFAMVYAAGTTRLSGGRQTLEFRTNVFSAALSVLVGLLWLALLSLGKLHDIFP